MTTQPTEEELKRLVWDKGSKKLVEPKDLSPPKGLKHYIFPADAMETWCAQEKNATLAVLLNIVRRWFSDYQQNPIKLATTEIRDFRVSKNQKTRALVSLEKAGFITVERRSRKSPMVFLTDVPLSK